MEPLTDIVGWARTNLLRFAPYQGNTMLKLLASASAITLAVSALPAAAQDAPATFDGLYVSGAVGLDAVDNGAKGLQFDVNRNGSFGDVVNTTTGANAFSPGFCTGSANGNNVGAGCTGDGDDVGYAVRVGFDKRMGSIVAGLLVEGSKTKAVDAETAFSTTPASYTFTRGVDYAIGLRGRLGFSPGDGRGLFYVTGGPSYADIDRAFTTTNTANSFALNDDGDDMVWGAQFGGGAEVLIGSNLTLGLEYLYSRYEDKDAYVEVGKGTAPATNPFLLSGGGTNLRPADRSIDMHSFRVTAGFQF
jgi:outer membrane immunogenic protein